MGNEILSSSLRAFALLKSDLNLSFLCCCGLGFCLLKVLQVREASEFLTLPVTRSNNSRCDIYRFRVANFAVNSMRQLDLLGSRDVYSHIRSHYFFTCFLFAFIANMRRTFDEINLFDLQLTFSWRIRFLVPNY